MDFSPAFKKSQEHFKAVSTSAHSLDEKLFNDAYDNYSANNKPLESQLINSALARQEVYQLEQKLLLEIAYIATLFYYYQRRSCNYSQSGYSSHNSHNYYSGRFSYNENIHNKKCYGSEQLHSKKTTNSFEEKPFTGELTRQIVSTARNNLGRPIWALSRFAAVCERGYLGCAATVSELLHKSGLKINGSASVNQLVHELSNSGWHKIKIDNKSQFKTGDIVYGLRGNHAHIGIITAVNENKVLVCDNSSSSATLKERTIESGGSFTPAGRFAGHLFVMRPNQV